MLRASVLSPLDTLLLVSQELPLLLVLHNQDQLVTDLQVVNAREQVGSG